MYSTTVKTVSPAVEKCIRHKIHAPALVGRLASTRERRCAAAGSAWALVAQIQPVGLVEAVYALVIDHPALAPKKRIDAPEAVNDPVIASPGYRPPGRDMVEAGP